MTKFGITVTAFFLLLGALALASAQPASTKNTILTNRIGPSGGELFLANGDGSGEHKLNSGGNMDYDAMFSTDGKWIVFTSERNGSANIYRIHPDGSGLERLTDDDGFDDQASLSPDDNQLAFVSTRGSGTHQHLDPGYQNPKGAQSYGRAGSASGCGQNGRLFQAFLVAGWQMDRFFLRPGNGLQKTQIPRAWIRTHSSGKHLCDSTEWRGSAQTYARR